MSEKVANCEEEGEEKPTISEVEEKCNSETTEMVEEKVETKESGCNNEDLPPFANITIKIEQTDETTDYPFLNEADLMVKIEGQEYNEEEEARASSPQPVYLIKAPEITRSVYDKNLSDNDTDDDCPRRKRPRNEGEDEPSNSKDDEDHPAQPEQFYADDILSKVEICQITEEERQKEHNEILKTRRHFKFLCEHCALGFVLESAYTMHMTWHSEESGSHECEVCHVHLKNADRLYRHKLRHYRRYRCTMCQELFKDRDAASAHIMTKHERRRFVCSYCGQRFKRPQYLKGHIDQHHVKKKKFECPECDKVFHERGRYRSHVRLHSIDLQTQTGPYPCRVCGVEAPSKSALRRHVISAHKTDHRCELCGEGFKDQDTLAQHLRKAHGAADTTGYPCPHCLRILTTRAMLNRHIKRMHRDRTKKFQCDECKRYYFTKGEVRSHIMWSHLRGLGGHVCACGRIFRTPARLRDHQARAHEDRQPERTHECGDCGKTFANKQVLNRHIKGHSNEVYPCTECNMTFKTQGYVKVHYKLKHLNMTRAEIKAQSKPFKPLMAKNVPIKNEDLAKIVKNMTKIIKNNAAALNCDPLLPTSSKGSSTLSSTEGLSVPLFETFSDIQRE